MIAEATTAPVDQQLLELIERMHREQILLKDQVAGLRRELDQEVMLRRRLSSRIDWREMAS